MWVSRPGLGLGLHGLDNISATYALHYRIAEKITKSNGSIASFDGLGFVPSGSAPLYIRILFDIDCTFAFGK